MKMNSHTPTLEMLHCTVLVIAQLKNETPSPWVDEAFLKSLIQAEARLREARNNLNQAKDALKGLAKERHLHGGALVKTVRDFYQVLTRAAKRDPANQHWLRVFSGKAELPVNPSLKHPWLEVAQRIADADLKVKAALKDNALACEMPPPSNPSAEEVSARHQAALEADRAWRGAVLVVKAHTDELHAARKQVHERLTSLRLVLRSQMIGWSHEQRRKVLRVFGFHFDAEPATQAGEPVPKALAPTASPQRATA